MSDEEHTEDHGAAKEPAVHEVVSEAAEGEVQWYGIAKGYGFVRVAGIDDDVFVHHSQLADPDNLMTGDKVKFRLVRTDRGFQAQGLEVVAEAKPPDGVR